MLVLCGIARDGDDAERRVRWAIASGAGVEKFRAIVQAQGGDPGVIDDYRRLPAATHREAWPAPRAGFVTKLDAESIGRAAMVLGAGRDRVDAVINHAVGIDVEATIGTEVQMGEPVLTLACDDPHRIAAARAVLTEAVEIEDRAAPASPRLLETIDERRVRPQPRGVRLPPAKGAR
jgi:pyrimidine-nucleoside phosphorylase